MAWLVIVSATGQNDFNSDHAAALLPSSMMLKMLWHRWPPSLLADNRGLLLICLCLSTALLIQSPTSTSSSLNSEWICWAVLYGAIESSRLFLGEKTSRTSTRPKEWGQHGLELLIAASVVAVSACEQYAYVGWILVNRRLRKPSVYPANTSEALYELFAGTLFLVPGAMVSLIQQRVAFLLQSDVGCRRNDNMFFLRVDGLAYFIISFRPPRFLLSALSMGNVYSLLPSYQPRWQ